MRNTFKLLIFCTLVSCSSQAQETDTSQHNSVNIKRSVCLLTGYSLETYSYAEIGVAKLSSTTAGHHPLTTAAFIGTEINLGNKFIAGPKVGVWASGGAGAMALGINMIYYTNFNKGSLVFRPEVGFGLGQFKLVYGYNAMLSKYRLDRINKNLVGLTYCFKVKQLKDRSWKQ